MLRARQARRARGNGGTGSAGSGADLDLFFSNSTYTVSGGNYTTLGSIPGFTFTRASLAMGYDATGKLTYGPNNLLLQSQTFDNASWNKNRSSVSTNATTAPDGTLTADKLVEDATASNTHRAYQNSTTSTAPYVWSVYAKADTRTWVYLRIDRSGPSTPSAWFNLATGVVGTVETGLTASIQSVGNGWYRCTIAVDTADAVNNSILVGLSTGNGVSSYTGDGTSGIYLWGAQLEAVTYQTTPSTYYPTTTAAYYGPRLVYDPVTLASLGILVEEARTNLCLQSQAFGTTWVLSNGTLTANSAVSPDGTTTADTLVGTAASSQGRLAQSFAGSIGATYTLSCYVKSAGGTLARLYFDDNATNAASVTYDSITGAVSVAASASGGNWTAVSSTAQQLGSGWWRFSLTFTATTVAPQRVVLFHRDVSDGTNGIYLWQAQLEQAVGASSPIPTTTASVTRAADVAAVTGLNVTYPMSETVDFATINGPITSTTQATTVVDNGAGVDEAMLYVSGSGSMRLFSETGASLECDLVIGSGMAANTAYKVAGRWAANDFQGARNGVLGTADTSGTVPGTGTRLLIGSRNAGFSFANGTISRIRIYNSALSDAELQAITQSLLLQEDGYSILQEDNSYIWLE